MARTQAASRLHAYQGLAPLRSLARAIAAAKPDLVVPGDDLATWHLHELYHRRQLYSPSAAELGTLIERSLGSPDAFRIADSRAGFIDMAREEGIRVPETGIVESEEALTAWVEHSGLPTVLKADGSSGGEGVRLARTAQEAHEAFRKLHSPPLLARAVKRAVVDHDKSLIWPSLRRNRPIVNAQRFVDGQEATSTVACWMGSVLASLHFEVLRKSSAAGHATVVRLIENKEMSAAVERAVRRMGISGLCGFDFMLEASTGNAYLIEMNPRATQVGHITLGAGRDLPGALYSAISGTRARVAPAVTERNTIALFPHEWARDPQSEFLRTGYHDVPWDTPELVHACIERSREQRAWYARGAGNLETATAAAAAPAPAVKSPAEGSAAARIAAR